MKDFYLMPKPRKPKPCKQCKEIFTPERSFQPCCGYLCAIDYAKAKIKEKQRVEHTKAKADHKNNDKSHLTKICQTTFNKYIRLRDQHLPCISCGHNGRRQRHASHFRPVGRNKQHRFNEDNCHASCSICNSHLSGNLIPYREALILKIGLEKVEILENDNVTKKYSLEELREITDIFKQKIKELHQVKTN